ncbi:MAG: cupin domain-containing protein [Woeseiaceae bacterium]|nr:cupin domain-containing protein [Woeseiaceae bacterium]
MRFFSASKYTGQSAWDALPIANMHGITTRLHWANRPYRWHVNDGEEVFVVLDGEIDMHYKEGGIEKVNRMQVGDIFFACSGTEHVAHPIGEARVLVVESEGSI